MVSVTAPQSAPSVAAIPASVETMKLAPRRPPASKAMPGARNAAAAQAQAAAASMAPARDGRR